MTSTMLRRAAVPAGAVLGLVLLTQVVLPRTTPSGIVALGLLRGLSTALLAVGMVLLYRSIRVINFAQAALGIAAGYLVFVLGMLFGWPFPVVLVVGLATAAAVGAAVDVLVMQRFFRAPRLVPTVATIVLVGLLEQAPSYLDRIGPIGRARNDLANVRALTDAAYPLPFADWSVSLEPFTYGSAAVFTLLACAAALGGLALFLHRSRLGRALRSVAENADRALLLGINVRLLSTVAWAIAGLLAGLAVVLQGFNEGFRFLLDDGGSNAVRGLVPALAAAVLARMTSLPAAVGWSLVIAVAREATLWAFPRTVVLDLAVFAVIAIGLVLQRKRILRSEAGDASTWDAVRELRPTPRALLEGVPGLRTARWAGMAAIGAVVLVLPWALPSAQTNLAGLIAIQAIVALSLVVLTGWAGQISLGQFAFVAVAAVLGGKLTADAGWSFWLALPLVVGVTAGFAALVGLPALRIKGSFLAVTTLAFAFALHSTLFGSDALEWLRPALVERPKLLFLSFSSERAYYYLCLVALVLAAMAVVRLRRSRPGRVLIGLRDNEAGVESAGINVVRTRLAAFSLSGGLAALAGFLFVHHQRAVDPSSYGPEVSIAIFVMAMIGGVTSVLGALLGATYLGLVQFLIADDALRTLATSGGLLMLLLFEPGGLAAMATKLRDSVLRIVALRQRIVVPSLFEDVDADVLAQRRTPLAEPLPGSGLEALDGRRYGLSSQLHRSGRAAIVLVEPGEGA